MILVLTDWHGKKGGKYVSSKQEEFWMVLSKTFQNCWTMNETLDFITSLFAKKEQERFILGPFFFHENEENMNNIYNV